MERGLGESHSQASPGVKVLLEAVQCVPRTDQSLQHKQGEEQDEVGRGPGGGGWDLGSQSKEGKGHHKGHGKQDHRFLILSGPRGCMEEAGLELWRRNHPEAVDGVQ